MRRLCDSFDTVSLLWCRRICPSLGGQYPRDLHLQNQRCRIVFVRKVCRCKLNVVLLQKIKSIMESIYLEDNDIIYRFAILEETLHFEYKQEFHIPEEYISKSMNMLEMLKILRLLLTYYGFYNAFPVCGFGDVKENTAGHTEYVNQTKEEREKEGDIISITIGNEAKGNPDRILAILTHELCHNILRLKNFPILTGIENEIYTDLATIYLGLGKYTLKGHKFSKTTEQKMFNQINYTTTTSTVGYLTDSTYYRAYIWNQIFRRYKDYSELPENIVNRLKGDRTFGYCKNIERLLKKRNTTSNIFGSLFKICCPSCQYVSNKPNVHLFRKKVRCSKCGNEFDFNWEFPLKEVNGAWIHSNNIFYYLYML